ncbi:hypothetical protein [Vibrio vulnificus]|uniref:hypothetical protein n=1 Tax=Vibrio vulnificus TaxID=672 RepID=UPI0032423B79
MKRMRIVSDDSLSLESLVGIEPDSPITLELIGFPGGSVAAMRNFIDGLSSFSDVRVHISGFLAGTGMWLLCFAKKITSDQDVKFCCLKPQAISFGNYAELENATKLLDEVDDFGSRLFLERFGINQDYIVDKWLSVSEMKALGFPIEVIS